jgi:hypothetical protein
MDRAVFTVLTGINLLAAIEATWRRRNAPAIVPDGDG